MPCMTSCACLNACPYPLLQCSAALTVLVQLFIQSPARRSCRCLAGRRTCRQCTCMEGVRRQRSVAGRPQLSALLCSVLCSAISSPAALMPHLPRRSPPDCAGGCVAAAAVCPAELLPAAALAASSRLVRINRTSKRTPDCHGPGHLHAWGAWTARVRHGTCLNALFVHAATALTSSGFRPRAPASAACMQLCCLPMQTASLVAPAPIAAAAAPRACAGGVRYPLAVASRACAALR